MDSLSTSARPPLRHAFGLITDGENVVTPRHVLPVEVAALVFQPPHQSVEIGRDVESRHHGGSLERPNASD